MSINITDEEILRQMGLTDDEVRDAETKFSQLDTAQQETLKHSTPTAESAAETFKPNVTPDRLMHFIRARSPKDTPIVICFNGGRGDVGKER